ncbi:MAG: aspartate/glutamate racemase family protein [Oscillospiraceae bacterium]
MKKLAVIHTTAATIQGLSELESRLLPNVRVSNFLDDSIIGEVNREKAITPGVRYRFYNLMNIASAQRPDAILCACSTVGEMAEDCRAFLSVPIFRIDEPMAEKAAHAGGKCAVLATVYSTVGPTCRLIERKTGEYGTDTVAEAHVIEGAGALLSSGKLEEYRMYLAEKLTEAAGHFDRIVLAQASMAAALPLVPESLHVKFAASPESGIMAVKNYFDTL